MPDTEHVHIAVIGTGFSGIAMAVRLQEDGVEDFVLLERAADVGGTWRDNSYPGCACDVPSHLYSLSFELNPAWRSTFSSQEEIWDYLRGCAERYGVLPHVRFGHEVLEAAWREDEQRWRIETSQGALTADVLVSAAGGLSEPSVPDLPGLETFAGTTFHSARWDHDHDLTGRRVAVIGTGASAIQFVPRIQPKVAALTLFQRTPPWIMPRLARRLTKAEQRVYRAVPGAQRLMRDGIYWAREGFAIPFLRPRLARSAERLAKRHLAKAVHDPELRRRLTPSYRFGCKRVLISNDYLPSLTRANVEVVTNAIREVRPHAVVTQDGTEHEVDTIIFGTGFHVTDMPIGDRVRGRDGRSLAESWRGSPQAHLGVTVAGFPNFFMLLGPNTGIGHTSAVFMAEAQIAHVREALAFLRRHGAAAVEPRPEAQAAFVAEVDRRGEGTVWTSGGCKSWYLDETGRNSTLWPGFTWPYKRRLARFEPSEYAVAARRAARPQPVAA